mmetsp:Transcript_58516/g.126594  ORF Transcript_58516/g.126594 Transcript_58516/m.126594 type:complete len:281 (-) Transcript_58516:3547-4389(-)
MMRRDSKGLVEKASRDVVSLVLTSTHSFSFVVTGSSISNNPNVLRYSPVMEDAVTLRVCSRGPPAVLPRPTLITISSTFICCRRSPCLDTNWSRKPWKTSFAFSGSRSTSHIRWAKMLLLGCAPTFGESRARSSSSMPASSKLVGPVSHPLSPGAAFMVWVIIRTKTVLGGPRLPAFATLLAPRYTMELRPMVGMIRSSSYSSAIRFTSRRYAFTGFISRRVDDSFQSSLAMKQAYLGCRGGCRRVKTNSVTPAAFKVPAAACSCAPASSKVAVKAASEL